MTEPFAWFRYQQGSRVYYDTKKWDDCQPLYTQSASEYERGFIDGMQKQMQSSVDKAVNRMAQTQEPVAYYHPHKGFYFAKPTSVSAPTTVDVEPLALYTTPPQRTERPVDCERCNRLEEHAYDLVGKLRVANIKLSMQPQRTWVDLTDEEIDNINYTSAHMLAREVLAKFKEKNT